MPANSLLFKPSVTQPFSQTPYDLNSKLLVRTEARWHIGMSSASHRELLLGAMVLSS